MRLLFEAYSSRREPPTNGVLKMDELLHANSAVSIDRFLRDLEVAAFKRGIEHRDQHNATIEWDCWYGD